MTVDIFASPMPRLPAEGELMLAERIAVFPGGNALNTAVALQRLGERVVFAGVLGDDSFGALLLAELQRVGLDTRGVKLQPGCATASTLIYRAGNEDRRYISALGAAEHFTGEGISPELIPPNGVLLAAGYYKLRAWKDEALLALLKEAQRRDCRAVLNVCISRDGEADPQRCLRLLPWVHVFVPNEDEARILTGEREPRAQARVLREAGAQAVVITRGPRGLYAEQGSRVVEMDAFRVPVVDPSGCGDCFTAGLIVGLLRQWDLEHTLKFASAVGALGATALGCTSGVPSFAEVERFLKQNSPPVGIAPLLDRGTIEGCHLPFEEKAPFPGQRIPPPAGTLRTTSAETP
jgi:sugar/nucleoside kinase (ribokinase family)